MRTTLRLTLLFLAVIGLTLSGCNCGEDDPPECEPETCDSLEFECGTHDDGCDGTVDCGPCEAGFDCEAGICVPETCEPVTCDDLGYVCGEHSDGCEGTIDCGTCDAGFDCVAGACVPEGCVPDTCADLGFECGEHDDGCEGTLDCGTCDAGFDCEAGTCVCVPTTCTDLGFECGEHDDTCGGTLDCGTCEDGFDCEVGVCVDNPCEPNPCTTAPEAACNDDLNGIVTFAQEGTCAIVDGSAECTYAPTVELCEADSVCDGNDVVTTTGACVLDGTAPVCEQTVVACESDEYCSGGECLPLCGNGDIDAGEDCDGTNLGGLECGDLVGYVGTGLACTDTCTFDVSACELDGTGESCADAYVVGVGTTQLTGTYTDDPAFTFSCGGNVVNTVWFEFTAQRDGEHTFTANNESTTSWSRIAVVEGTSCDPLGTEIGCDTLDSTLPITSTADLVAGQPYLIAFWTDGSSWPMTNPSLTIEQPGPCNPNPCDDPPEAHCSADDSAIVSYAAIGECEEDGENALCTYIPTETACDTPPAGFCDGNVFNHYDSVGTCGGTPVECSYAPNTTDCSDTNQVCTSSGCIDAEPGEYCPMPALATEGTTSLTGTFSDHPGIAFTCGGTVTNAVWFEFTAQYAGEHEITAVNQDGTGPFGDPYSRMAIVEGAECDPLGTEVVCGTAADTSIARTVELAAGVPYLIVFWTDGTTYTMENPALTIVGPPPPSACNPNPCDQPPEPACSADGTTLIAYPAIGECELDANDDAVCTYTPIETSCQTTPASHCDGNVYVTYQDDGACAGTPAQCVWTTNTQDCTVTDQACTATGCVDAIAGEYCPYPAVATEGITELAGTFNLDLAANTFTCGGTPWNTVWFEFTPLHSGDHVITLTNQTTTNAWTRMVVLDGIACNPYDQEVDCGTANAKVITRTVELQAGETYLIVGWTDGNTYTMVDPVLSVLSPGAYAIDWCAVTWPESITAVEGSTETVYGEVYIAGLTDLTQTLVDEDPLVMAAVGVGPAGTDPELFQWSMAAPNPSPNPSNPNNDEYMGQMVVPPAADGPEFDYAYAFSGDGGITWTVCDADGGDYDSPRLLTSLVSVAEWDFRDEDLLTTGGIVSNENATIGCVGANFTGYAAGYPGSGTQAPSCNAWNGGAGTYNWGTTITTTGYEGIMVSAALRSSGTGPRDFQLEFSTDGATWVPAGNPIVLPNADWLMHDPIMLPAAADNQASLQLRWLLTSETSARETDNIGAGGTNRMDIVVIGGSEMP